MIARVHERRHVASVVLVVAIALLGVSALFLNTNPEYVRVASEDGGLVVSGSVPADTDIRIVKDRASTDALWTAVASDVYVVSPDGVQLPADVMLEMPTRGREGTYQIAWFDVARNVWTPVQTQKLEGAGVFRAATNHFSHWALLVAPQVTVGDVLKDRLVEQVLEGKPEGAVSYHLDMAYATVDGDYVLVAQDMQSGRCETAAPTQQESVETSVEARGPIEIGGARVMGSVRILATWSLGAGCAQFIETEPSTRL